MASPATIPVTCSCGRTFLVPDSAAGKRARCPGCEKAARVPIPAVETSEVDHLSGTEIRSALPGLSGAAGGGAPSSSPSASGLVAPRGPDGPLSEGHREYKVLSRACDRPEAGRFRPEELERALNTQAAQGWVLHSIVVVRSAEATGDELVAILERPA